MDTRLAGNGRRALADLGDVRGLFGLCPGPPQHASWAHPRHEANGFLTPRNLWNLSVQTSSIADHGDGHGAGHRHPQHRPVGRIDPGPSRHVTVGLSCRWRILTWRRLGLGHPAIWIITLIFGIAIGALIGAFQGVLIAYLAHSGLHRDAGRASGLAGRRRFWSRRAARRSRRLIDDLFALLGGGPYRRGRGEKGSWIIGVHGLRVCRLGFT
jgi:D-xylose transport system permease protein